MDTYNSDKWDGWMKAALRGDQKAYRELLLNLTPWLGAYFGKRIHPAIVDDLVQETLMSLHAKRETYDPARPFGPWISAVARHRWIDYMRKSLRHTELEIHEDFPAQDNDKNIAARHDVATMLGTIPPAQAEVIELVKLKEMTIAEAAAKTGHSESSVKVMIHRGMKKMMAAAQDFKQEAE